MRRSHRLALSAAALCFGLALGGAGIGIHALRPQRAEARAGSDGAWRAATAGRAGAAWREEGARALGGTRAEPASARNDVLAPDADERARPASTPAAHVVPIALDTASARGVTLAVGGHDPAAPRALDLWRIEADGRRARIARGHSEADGSLVFPPLVLPGRSIEMIATPRGVPPDDASASRPIVVRRDPAAPRVEVTPEDGGIVLRVEATESGGAIVVEAPASVPGEEAATVASVALVVTPDAVPAPLEIALADARGVALAVVQIDPDGRRSPPRLVFVDAEQPNEEQE